MCFRNTFMLCMDYHYWMLITSTVGCKFSSKITVKWYSSLSRMTWFGLRQTSTFPAFKLHFLVTAKFSKKISTILCPPEMILETILHFLLLVTTQSCPMAHLVNGRHCWRGAKLLFLTRLLLRRRGESYGKEGMVQMLVMDGSGWSQTQSPPYLEL